MKTNNARHLRIESLETREMLSVNPLGIDTFNEQESVIPAVSAAIAKTAPVEASNNSAALSRSSALAAPQVAAAAPPYALSQTFTLHSKADSKYRIYLDFDGFTSDTNWQQGVEDYWSLDDDKTAFSDDELDNIQQIWQIISERFTPFDVDVTTDTAMFDAPDNPLLKKSGAGDADGWGIRVVFGATGGADWAGIAYLGSFDWDTDTPCYVVDYGGNSAASCAVHEIGHTLGLGHDGLTAEAPGGAAEYYGGHQVSTNRKWGPIMGSPYTYLEQFDKGEYLYASNKQDDLASITGYISYRPDAVNSELVFVNEQATVSGIIERSYDVDEYTFTVSSLSDVVIGSVSGITVNGNTPVSSLYYSLDLYKGNALIVHTNSSLVDFTANITKTLDVGDYTVKIAGCGYTPEGDFQGFSGYGSLGSYSVIVSGVQEGPPKMPGSFRSFNQTTGAVALSWNSPRRLTAQKLQYRLIGTDVWWDWGIGAADNSTTITGLQADTYYEIRLCAVNSVGESDWATITAKTKASVNPRPAVPEGFTGSAQNTDSVSLVWNSQINITKYELRYKVQSDTEWTELTVPLIKTSAVVSSLENGTYQFQLRAVNKDTASDWTEPVTVTVGVPVPATPDRLEKPTGVAATPSGSGVKLTWNAVDGAAAYYIYRSADNGKTYEWVSTRLAKNFNGQSPYFNDTAVGNGSYIYAVRAYDSALSNATRSDAETATVTVVGVAKLEKPTGVAATPSGSGVKLTWNAVDGAAAYYIYRSADNGKTYEWVSTRLVKNFNGKTPYFDDTAVGSGSYIYAVRAYDAALSNATRSDAGTAITVAKTLSAALRRQG
ncbi:MAG: fibronectin type III domain-containing protein [Planctomycetaceae bacterium]|jgi:hypothetical protein|nr:fibronectin type III domain-containing protein [Planctomycetaceae bacterium]